MRNASFAALVTFMTLTVLLVAVLGACKSPIDETTGTITISLSGAANGSARAVWPPNSETLGKLIHKIILTGPGPMQTHEINGGNSSFSFTVIPGDWTVTVEARLDGVLYATGSSPVSIKAGQNEKVTIEMKHAGYTVTITGGNDEQGTATANPASAAAGDKVIITATPKTGYKFKEWEATGVTLTANDKTTNPLEITMPTGAITIKAVFEVLPPNTPDLSLSAVEFADVTSGYAQPTAKTVTITNTGTGTGVATVSSIKLGGTNAASFTLGGGYNSITSIAAGGTATFTVQPKTGLDAGTYSAVITVTYSGNNKPSGTAIADLSFTVNAVTTPDKILSGIAVTTPPVKTTYTVGDVFDSAGMVVTATYNDGSTDPVTGYTLSGFNSSTVGLRMVTVTYEGKTATFTVTVGYAITMTSSDNDHGTVTATPSMAFSGDTVTITAAPETGYTFSNWTATGVTLANTSANPATFIMPNSAVTIHAVFVAASSIPGSEGNPFEVHDVATLQKVGTETTTGGWTLTAHYRQTATIDMIGQTWAPIANNGNINPDNMFNGVYDGGGFEIQNLSYSATAGILGLFGNIGTSGIVKNLAMPNVNISGSGYAVGGLAGYSEGMIVNCSVTGNVSTTSNISGATTGGVVGYGPGTIKNCYFSGTVTGNDSVGGIVGDGKIIENCYSMGTVTGTSSGQVGGVAGMLENSGMVSNCYSTAKLILTGTNGYIGGVAGALFSNNTIENCVALNESIFTSATNTTNLGRVLNIYSGSTGTMIINNYARSDINMKYDTNAQGTIGNTYTVNSYEAEASSKYGANITAAEWNSAAWWIGTAHFSTTIWNIVGNKLPTLRDMPGTAVQDPEITYTPGQLAGTGTQADPFIVHDVATLQKVASGTDGWANASSTYYEQVRHIDLSSVANWTPIGSSNYFYGSYDGGGFEIRDLKIIDSTSNSLDGLGLFSRLGTGGSVSNVALVGVSITSTGSATVGGLAGSNQGTITNCSVVGEVSGNGINLGGVVAQNSDGTIANCSFTGKVTNTGSGPVGGVVGLNSGTVTNCYAAATVSGTGLNMGGVVGANQETTVNCYSTGTVTTTGSGSVGGVVGLNSGTVTNCYSTAEVSGTGGSGVGGVIASGSSSVEKSVALNKSVVATTYYSDAFIGRVVGSIASNPTMNNNYARSTGMTITYNNGTAYTPSSPDANNKDGEGITATQWGSASWWQGLGFTTANWDFTGLSATKLPTLKGMTTSPVQNPVVE
jgi:hypothetical protein